MLLLPPEEEQEATVLSNQAEVREPVFPRHGRQQARCPLGWGAGGTLQVLVGVVLSFGLAPLQQTICRKVKF